MITVGEMLPVGELSLKDNSGVHNLSTDALFANKKVVMFAVPGAFTPTCSEKHLPGYVALASEFKAKGVDDIMCLSVNDAFVMHAWGESQNAGELKMLADGNGAFTNALGLGVNTGAFGGIRSRRYAMIIDNGQVTYLNVEAPKEFAISDARTMLALL